MISLEQLKAGLRLRNVLRWQTHRLQQKQYVDQHSARATWLYVYLGGTEPLAMLAHDFDEAITGDIPTPIKKDLQGLEKFEAIRVQFQDPTQKRLGDLCDLLELILDLKEQQVTLRPDQVVIYENELERMFDIAKELGKTKEVKKLLKELA